MAKFNEYPAKTTPEDNDTLMIYDAAAKANKLSPFSGVWNWIVDRLANAVVSKLTTSNKTVIGAVNELNGRTLKGTTYSSLDDIPLQTQGIYVLSKDIRPDPYVSVYMGFYYGNVNLKVLFLVGAYTKKIHINAWEKGSAWKGWKDYS